MKFLSVCSGIEAASVAWNPLGWEAEAFSEIEPFPCQVLKHHYPNVPNLGDMTKFKEWNLGPIDLFCGGTPCQSFSVAGLRKGLDDPRGNLMLTYLAIADKFRPRWLVWENVPGVLSSNGGRDFGAFLGGLGKLGYGFAYRVLDAQYFGVAQRRKRVFVVGYLGDWRPAAAVLFERDSLCGNPAPSRKKGQETSQCLTTGSSQRYDAESETMIPVGVPDVMATLLSSTAGISRTGNAVTEHETYIPMAQPTIVHGTQDPCVSDIAFAQGRNNGGENVLVQPIALAENTIGRKPENGGNGDGFTDGGPMYTLNATGVHGIAQPIGADIYNGALTGDVAATLTKRSDGTGTGPSLLQNMAVRRLTPVECERLQGFPDHYTDIKPKGKPTSDGPRYKALGNSWAVPVVNWIGKRIMMVEEMK
jgi:DNA (cytosine-5)-methyltransferase 1